VSLETVLSERTGTEGASCKLLNFVAAIGGSRLAGFINSGAQRSFRLSYAHVDSDSVTGEDGLRSDTVLPLKNVTSVS